MKCLIIDLYNYGCNRHICVSSHILNHFFLLFLSIAFNKFEQHSDFFPCFTFVEFLSQQFRSTYFNENVDGNFNYFIVFFLLNYANDLLTSYIMTRRPRKSVYFPLYIFFLSFQIQRLD